MEGGHRCSRSRGYGKMRQGPVCMPMTVLLMLPPAPPGSADRARAWLLERELGCWSPNLTQARGVIGRRRQQLQGQGQAAARCLPKAPFVSCADALWPSHLPQTHHSANMSAFYSPCNPLSAMTGCEIDTRADAAFSCCKRILNELLWQQTVGRRPRSAHFIQQQHTAALCRRLIWQKDKGSTVCLEGKVAHCRSGRKGVRSRRG